jgi:ATP-binding cassette, subfamily B, bacterial
MKTKKYLSLDLFWRYAKTGPKWMFVCAATFLISDALIATVPYTIGKLIGEIAGGNKSNIMLFAILIIVVNIGHAIFWHLSELIFVTKLNNHNRSIEDLLFSKILNKPYSYFVNRFSGKISSYVTNLSLEYREIMDKFFWEYIDIAVKLPTTFILLATVNWQTMVIFAVGMSLMYIFGKYLMQPKMKAYAKAADLRSTLDGEITDAVSNFPSIKAFNSILQERKRMSISQSDVVKSSTAAWLRGIYFWAAMSFVVRWIIISVSVLYNVYQYKNGLLTITQLAVFFTVLLTFTDYIWRIISEANNFSTKLAYWEESYRYLFGDEVVDLSDASNKKPIIKSFKNIDLSQLTFNYPDHDEMVLNNISIQIKKGEKIGIVGRSGGGKSTLFGLLLGYYDVKPDMIQLDGKSASLKGLVSYVPQDTALFHRSISENIGYAASGEPSSDDIKLAAKRAHAAEFINKLPEGYDTIVGERGVKLSIGQRQRIAIARAFLDDKPILLLDEATSALDSESEQLVQAALEELWEDKTVIAIAHRLSTLRHMDRIVVIQDGSIVEQGTHKELLALGGVFAELWAHQSGGMLEE